MKCLAALPLLAALASVSESAAVSPVQKVVQMLEVMKTKGAKAMQEEQLTFQTYTRWAELQSQDLAQNLKFAASKVEELAAQIAKADSDAQELGGRIAALDKEIGGLEAEKQAATDDRKKQHEEYTRLSEDYAESVAALEQAIQVLSSQDYDREQAESMLQKMAKTVPGMPRVLAAFTQVRSRSGFLGRGPGGAPPVAAYEFQSSNIIDVLKGLLDKFRGELAEVEKAEANEAHAFALAELHLTNTISRDKSDREEHAVQRAARLQTSSQAKGELAAVKADQAADSKMKADVEATLEVKKAAFQENQEVRQAELKAIGKAIEILSSDAVQQGYAKHLTLGQRAAAAGASFLQLRRASRRATDQDRALELLQRRAAALHSNRLARLAADVAASPFAKVIEMIETLLERLREEAASEADHKEWCDKELKANKLKREKKSAEAEKLAAEIESISAKVQDMAATIEKLTKEQAELAVAMSEATDLRAKERAENEEAIKDAAAGAEAVKKALEILKVFYAAQSGAFLQQGHKQVPELAAYRGLQDENGGIIGMLEVIASDFTRLRSETETAESTASREYDKFMKSSEALKKEKHETEFKLSLDKDEAEFQRSQRKKDLENVQAELGQANRYFAELKPSCVQVHVSFEERVKSRQEEIDALNEAWHILDRKSKE